MADPHVREVGLYELGILADSECALIPLGGERAAGRRVLVDPADYEQVSRHSWSVTTEGPYAGARVGGQRICMHAFLSGWRQTDHWNHDGLDNRRANLRPVTRSQNNANARPRAGGTSQHKGVYWSTRRSRWVAEITSSSKRRHLGVFASEEAAARAYDAAAREVFGEFACLNFPDGPGQAPQNVRVGVDGPLVTLTFAGSSNTRLRFGPHQQEEFAQLIVAASWEAARQAGELAAEAVSDG